jgi:hypothetical protein
MLKLAVHQCSWPSRFDDCRQLRLSGPWHLVQYFARKQLCVPLANGVELAVKFQ